MFLLIVRAMTYICVCGVNEQAYTQELEIKVSHLEEENERLKRLHVCFIFIANLHLYFIPLSGVM